MPFVVVSRAACFAVSLRLAAFGGAGWPARWVFVRWVVGGGVRAVVCIVTSFITARAASRVWCMSAGGLFVVRRPQRRRRCLAFQAGLWCCSPAVQGVAV